MSQKPPRDRGTFAPRIPAGIISVKELRNLIDVVESEGAENVKFSGETVFVWGEGEHPPENIAELSGKEGIDFKFGGVRPVKLCSAETFCQRFQRPVRDLALELDKRYYGRQINAKLVIGVAGCQRSCSEPGIKDVGVRAHPKGYEILVGGCAGLKPRIAWSLCIVPTKERVLEIVDAIVDYSERNCKRSYRLGVTVEKRGIDAFKEEVLA